MKRAVFSRKLSFRPANLLAAGVTAKDMATAGLSGRTFIVQPIDAGFK